MATRKPKGKTPPVTRSRPAAKPPRAISRTTRAKATTKATAKTAGKRTIKAAAAASTPRRKFPQNLIKVTQKATFQPAASRAAGVPAKVSIAAHRNDVVEVVFDNGLRYFTRFDQFRTDYGGAQSRDAASPDEFIIPAILAGPGADRSIGTWVIKSLRFLGIDPIEATAELTARAVCEWYEQKQLYHESPDDTDTQRLWQVVPGDEFKLKKPAPITGEEPLLVFLHGTASSSRGSFGELWAPNTRDVRQEILGPYGDRVYAFEHYSMTQSPMQNALALLAKIPDGACLHLVSHSRGGLVGELLSRAQVIDRDPFAADEIAALFSGPDYAQQAQELKDLSAVLKAKKIRVERFARVACPARGTTLASDRMDRWLSVSLDVIGEVADLATSGFYAVFEEFVKAFVNTTKKPGELPGLEAMMPTSPLVRLLNRADVKTSADLHVIAGDIEGGSILRRLGILLTDLYYREDHDLVVNTRAMYGGTPRITPPRRFFAQGPDVYHFTYFRNRPTALKVAAALHRPPAQDGFSVFDQQASALRGFRAPAAVTRGGPRGTKPIVFVLPGIMGSLLDANGARVWIDIGALNRGALDKLAIDATGVAPVGLVQDTYAEFLSYLDRTHEVVPFPFDWRLSLRAEAKRLAVALGPWLDEADRRGQPLSIIAHSLGGLLARVLIAQQPKTWERIIGKPQGRLVQLGTPNGGSYSIPLMLVGREGTVQKLALLDFKHSLRELLRLIGAFPGVLELLPARATPDFFNVATWTNLHTLDTFGGVNWQPPDAATLDDASAVRAILDGSTPNLDRIVYVAGCAPRTPCRLVLAPPPQPIGGTEGSVSPATDGQFYFETTPEGDGRVPWATGILAGLRPWYMDAVHGDLPATPRHFDALHDLLTTGTTDRLPTTAPVVAKRSVEDSVYRSPPENYVPDAADVEAAALGRQRLRPVAPSSQAPIDVSVVHGNLAFTRTPVFVGHYAADEVISAEKFIDGQMGGRLSASHQLGLYPDRINTARAFLSESESASGRLNFPGAIVAGLGEVGELTPAKLASTFEHAVLVYAVALIESAPAPADGGSVVGKITTLLIGTGWNAMSVRDCVTAILRGVVRANTALTRSGYKDRVRIGEVEFLELYEDRAIQAARALRAADADAEFVGYLKANPVLRRVSGGRTRAFFEDSGPWWHRLQIAGADDGALKFTMLTDRARAETRLQPTQRALVEAFVERQIATIDTEKHLAVTLFELLLPNDLKDRAPEGRDLVVVLDQQTAGYPWELLQDGAVRRDVGYSGLEQARIALRAGLIRQLATEQFRPVVAYATKRTALVVGNPKIGLETFPDLPGALQEAEAVRDALGHGGSASYEVKYLPEPDAEQVIHALFERPYRILHLAGHGVYEFDDYELSPATSGKRRTATGEGVKPPKVTGMVLGKGMFLTPAEVQQMRAVPEMVFINCCHLGRMNLPEQTGSRHLLAANLAIAFIEMGVKVVVAAGWAVDDHAAALFARTFYEQLLAGTPFGNAVLAARRRTASEFPAVNTWGAYQCYGDYAWRLETDSAHGGTARAEQFASSAELVIELANLASDAQSARPEVIDILNQKVEALLGIVAGARAEWLGSADVRAAFANVLGELDHFDDALSHYAKALAAGKAEFPVRAIEQYANLLTRAAAFEVRSVDAKAAGASTRALRSAARDKIDQAIALLTNLVAIGKTSERLSLLGSAWKRCAFVETDIVRRRAALARMGEYYHEAHLMALARTGAVDPYPLLNWLAAQACLKLFAGSPAKADQALSKDATDAFIAQIAQQLAKASDRDPWGFIQQADLAMVKPLLTQRFDAATCERVIGNYRRAYKRAGSPRQLRSVVEHVEFLAAMYADKQGRGTAATAAQLERCARALHELAINITEEN